MLPSDAAWADIRGGMGGHPGGRPGGSQGQPGGGWGAAVREAKGRPGAAGGPLGGSQGQPGAAGRPPGGSQGQPGGGQRRQGAIVVRGGWGWAAITSSRGLPKATGCHRRQRRLGVGRHYKQPGAAKGDWVPSLSEAAGVGRHYRQQGAAKGNTVPP